MSEAQAFRGIEEFSQGNTFIHNLDPRAKIVTTIVFSVVTAMSNSIITAAGALIFPLVLIVSARIDIRKVLGRLYIVNVFILFLWIFLPVTFPGDVIYAVGPVKIHREGLFYALLITLKSNAIVLTVIALLGTSPIFTLVHALSHLWIPDKLVHLFFFCFRYIHVINDEYRRLQQAMKIRGFQPGTNMHTYRTYAYLVGILLVRSFDRAERIVAAMKCRGFKGKFYILNNYEMKHRDYLVAASGLAFSAILLVVK